MLLRVPCTLIYILYYLEEWETNGTMGFMYSNLYSVLSRRMRNLWYYGFLALMYVFTTWAVETFGEQQTSMGNPLFKILIPPPPPGARGPVLTGKRVRREGESQALLETMSLSYGGNYYVSESIKQVKELSMV